MGLFSTKKKKKFFTAVQRMISDEDIVLSSKAGITNWLFTPQGGSGTSLNAKGLPDFLIEAGMSSLPNKFKRAYRTADKGYYEYGLPKAANISREGVDTDAAVKSIIESEIGNSIDLLYVNLGEASYYHFMWKLLIDDYGYDSSKNELTNLSAIKGSPCYLESARLVYTSATIDSIEDFSYLDQPGLSSEFGKTDDRALDLTRPHVAYVLDEAALVDHAEISYSYLETIPDVIAPNAPEISDFDGTSITGLAEKNSTILVYSGGSLIKTGYANSLGRFSFYLNSEVTSQIRIVARDEAGNVSPSTYITAPYSSFISSSSVGSDPSPTVVKRTVKFDLTFEDYIDSTVVDEAEDSTQVVTYTPDESYLTASYTYVNAGVTTVGFLTYKFGSNPSSPYEGLLESSTGTGEFFPRLYARLDGIKLNTLPKTDLRYKTSKRLGKDLGMDWVGWVNTVHDSIESINDVQQLFITECAPLNTEDPIIAQYLFHYFLKIYTEQDSDPTFSLPMAEPFNIKKGIIFNIKDEVYEHGVSFEGLGYGTVNGNIGDTGTFEVTYVPGGSSRTPFNVGGRTVFKITSTGLGYHSIKFQTSASEYKEIRVYSMSSRHSFSGGSTIVTGTDEGVVIPLDRSALPILDVNEKEILFSKCLYMFINVVKVIKTKWYQRGAFKVVMALVAIAISVVTVGAGAPVAAYLYAAATALAIGFAVGIAVTLLAKILVKLGVNSGVVTAITAVLVVLAIFAGANGVNVGNVTPQALLRITNVGFQTAERMNGIALGIIMKAMEAFSTVIKSQQELLAEAQKMLDSGTIPLSIDLLLGDLRSRVLISVGESVDMFFSRTVGLGNLASIPAELTSAYVDVALTLPDAHTMLKRMKEN